jgi:excisionase family DNA binding protein
MVMAPEREPIVAESAEIGLMAALEEMLGRHEADRPTPARLIGSDGQEMELPPALFAVLVRAAHELAAGNGVAIMPVESMLTTQQAADILNISRPHLIKMLEAGTMPFRMVGTHRRIRLQDVIEYQRRQDDETQQALANMSQLAVESGTYDLMPDES